MSSLSELAHQPGSHLVLFPDLPPAPVTYIEGLRAQIQTLNGQLAVKDATIGELGGSLLAAQAEIAHLRGLEVIKPDPPRGILR